MLRSEICVLDRIGPPNRQARPLASRAALLAFLESLQQAQTMLRRKPDPRQRRPHSIEGNIFLSATTIAEAVAGREAPGR